MGGEVFNVGSNANNHRIREIGQMICDEVEGSQLEIDDKDADRRDYRVCFDKIERRLRFKAEWSVKDGIRQIIESVRSGQVTSYTEPQHSNIAYLHEAGDSAFTKKQRVWTSELLNLPELPEELTKNDGDKRAS